METTQTVSAIGIARDRIDFETELLTVIEQESGFLDGIDDFNPFSIGLWSYDESTHVAGLSANVRRTWALEWLRTHARLIARVAKRMGHDGPILKAANESWFGVHVTVRRSTYVSEVLTAQVPANLTCEMVYTGETRHIPAVPARDELVMERRCPGSIFAGIESEVEV